MLCCHRKCVAHPPPNPTSPHPTPPFPHSLFFSAKCRRKSWCKYILCMFVSTWSHLRIIQAHMLQFACCYEGEFITRNHNVVVPLLDNPTAFRDCSSWPAHSQCSEKPGHCGRMFVYNCEQSRCYKCIRAVMRLDTHHTAWRLLKKLEFLFNLCVFIFLNTNYNF